MLSICARFYWILCNACGVEYFDCQFYEFFLPKPMPKRWNSNFVLYRNFSLFVNWCLYILFVNISCHVKIFVWVFFSQWNATDRRIVFVLRCFTVNLVKNVANKLIMEIVCSSIKELMPSLITVWHTRKQCYNENNDQPHVKEKATNSNDERELKLIRAKSAKSPSHIFISLSWAFVDSQLVL